MKKKARILSAKPRTYQPKTQKNSEHFAEKMKKFTIFLIKIAVISQISKNGKIIPLKSRQLFPAETPDIFLQNTIINNTFLPPPSACRGKKTP